MAAKRPREESGDDDKAVVKSHKPLSPCDRIAQWLVYRPGLGRLIMRPDDCEYDWAGLRGSNNFFILTDEYDTVLVTSERWAGSTSKKEARIDMGAPLEFYSIIRKSTYDTNAEFVKYAKVDWASTARSLYFTEDTNTRDVRLLLELYLIDDVARLCLSYVTGTMGPALDQEFEEWK